MKRITRGLALLLAMVMLITGCELQPVWAASDTAAIQAAVETIDDAQAKAEILAALEEGAEVTLTYTEDGRVAAYKIVREGVSKRHEDMTDEEKTQALALLIDQGVVKNRISVDGVTYSLNLTLWRERGIIVYGETAEVNNKVSVTSGANYKDGQYRYWGYDINGGLYGNDDFPRDSDSGTAAYEKDWLTTEEIKESTVARGYIGEHGLSANSRYTAADKTRTARAWLAENPAWKSAGLDESYILEHFYFNSVLTDNGLTTGQFTGVHLSRQSGTLYYQSFAVQGEIPTFQVTEGTIRERILIEDGSIAAPEEPETPETPSDISVEVELGAPAQTYVGHPTILTDRSVFTVDGEVQSATRVYADGLATSRFRLPSGGGSIKKNSSVPTRAEAVFDSAGSYDVRLTVTPKGGSGISDTKTIEVLEVPAIGHSLTGTQKENRKQVLNLWVATHPDRPLETLTVTITDLTSGETVTLDHHVGPNAGIPNTLENSETIKTRPVQAQASDELFTNCQLEFLTKNSQERTFRYTVHAEDSAGKTDTVTADFTVKPDLAPVPAMDLEPSYLRETGTNVARIAVSDASTTDGDQLERQWSVATYEDLSFGSKKDIVFEKTGVGPFELQLQIKDVWTEPTLEEYVTEADRKAATIIKSSEVSNVAPQVSMTPVDTKTAELLFLTTSPAVLTEIQSQLTQVKTRLLEQGIDAKLTVEQILPAESSETVPWEKTVEVNTPFGYQGSWTALYESNNFIADNKRLYKIDATWQGSDMSYYPQSPYTITAWDGETGEVDWTYTFTSEFLTVPNSGPYFAQDDTGMYLYFVASGQTLILDKETGALLAKLPVAVGNVNFVDQNRILTVKSDGIYAIHTGTGAMTKVYSGTFGAGGTRVSGVLQCVIQAGKTLYRGKMDLTTGKMRLQPLEGTTAEGGSYSAEAFGTDGTLLVKEVNGTRITFTKYGTSGQILASHSYAADRLAGMAVRDGFGNVDYVVYTVNSKSSDKYKTTMICAELATGHTASASLTDVNGYPAEVRIIAAEQVDETVYMAVGGYLTWIANYSWGNGPTHGYPQRTRVAQFNMAGPSGSIVAAGVMGMDNMKEYGKSSEVYGVIQSGQNGQYQSPPSGNITTLYRRNQTVEEAAERLKAKYLRDDSDRDLQKAFVLTEADLRDEGLAQLVDRQLDYDSMDRTSYVKLTPEEANASLSRKVTLKPDTTYYYEYDLYTPEEGAEPQDVFAVEPSLSRVTEEHLTGLQYRVVKSEKIADRIQAVTGAVKSKVSTSTKTTSFTVEEGQRAVLSFDYLVQKYSVSAYLADYVLIDGVRWKMPFHKSATTTTYSGHYTHPFLLEAGEHTIQVTARSYGTNKSTLTIDDVTLEYVEQGAPVLEEAQSQIRSLGDGWSRVSGSFTTPKETLAYEGLEGTLKAETVGTGGFTSTAKPNDRTTNLTIVKPTSETAIYTSVQTTSKPLRKDSKYYSVQWTVGGVSYYAYVGGYWGTNDDERITTFDLPHSHDFVLADGWSNAAVQLITKGSYSNGYSSGSMGQVLMASVVQPNDATTQRRYFLDLENGAILASNLRYENEATIRFAPNGEDSGAGVANLRIYTVQNGVREYAVEEDITDPAELERWTENGLTAEPMEDGAPVEETDSLVYAKGQLVTMDIQYRDYENDPSKASYYRYTHEPFNDGLHPLAGQVLTEPIDRFYVDGKYILEHYQIDSTGDPDYDKASNIATAVFYIGGAGDAPWIESIATNPAKPEEGSPFTIRVAVDDTEKDPLTLKVEVYKEGTRIYTETFSNLTANSSGDYPPAVTSPIAGAEAGRYEVVCTVSDETGTGIANRQFTIQPAGRIEGQVAHTAAWDSNRRSYNVNLFGSNASLYNEEIMSLAQYLSYPDPRPRGKNVFWAGEELILTATVGGSPTSVTAEADGYNVRLSSTGTKTETGDTIYKGSLWSSSMRNTWGKTPEEVTVRFTAYYLNGEPKVDEGKIIVDSNVEYWLLHRYQ